MQMVSIEKAKLTLELIKAFKNCFCDEQGHLSKSGQAVVAYLRDIAQGKGELGKDGSPYFYDAQGRFDACAVAFIQGKRAVFDQVVKYLSLDEKEVLNLIACLSSERANLEENINI
ncbi:MAG: hypothetical protein IJ184_07245 [Alphaproteobacteria bacterium]|nr:hypothetical protein [Alphaproteobacteria bacterium]